MSLLRTLSIDVLLVAVALAVGEMAVRTWAPQQLVAEPEGIHQFSAELAYEHVPGADVTVNVGVGPVRVRINSLGMRDREYGEKQPGERRILAVGNSFSTNYGVAEEEMYTEVLERLLSEDLGGLVSVLNVGVVGWRSPHYLGYVRREIARLDPDLVLVMFFNVSDNVTSDEIPKVVLRDGRVVLQQSGGLRAVAERIFRTVNGAAESSSHLFVWLRRLLDGPLWAVGLRPYPYIPTYRTDFNADGKYDVTYRIYRELREVVRAAGAEMVIVLVPAIYEFDEESLRRYCRYMKIDPTTLDLDAPRLAAEREFDAAGIPWIDLTPIFRARNREEPVYSSEYGHWNPRGNRLAAEAIARWIEEHDAVRRPE